MTMQGKIKNISFVILLALLLNSCHNNKRQGENALFEIKDFKTLTNWSVFSEENKSEKLIYLDYNDAINGFVIPGVRQTDDGFFHFGFSIKNTGDVVRKFCYKLYFQNETYKFPECIPETSKENILAEENFYGSWEEPSAFAITPDIPIDGKFHDVDFKLRIKGNPRNEQRYFADSQNDRWKRNPRTGSYTFLLVVTTNENFNNNSIPDYISDISKKNGDHYSNPFFYFLHGKGKNLPNTVIINSGNVLSVVAKPSITGGIYVHTGEQNDQQIPESGDNYCGSSETLYKNAPFKHFVSYVDTSAFFDNIPIIADVLNENYSLRDYNWNRTFYKKEEMIRINPSVSDNPCERIHVDTLKPSIIIVNKATQFGEWKKQNTGISTRHGLTYGKYTIKIKMAELLNTYGIWNGITNSIWLVTQKDEAWNNCRRCSSEGYLPKYGNPVKKDRSDLTAYSEIDFEILKTISYCPTYQFPPAYYYPAADRKNSSYWNVPFPKAIQQDSANVMVCCTNWDMACPQPEKFDVGCKPVNYGNKTFMAHRWDYWYQALSERSPESDDELFASEYYYFQIEWRPTEIIWRIGPEKNKLRVVGYMNDEITSIPNNQMLLVISQEFHDTAWWHGSPFEQRYIPFPKNDISGIIYEITIE